MLSLSRKLGERIMIGPDIVVTVVEIKGGRVRLEFEAPHEVVILREEIIGKPTREDREGRG